MNGFLRNGFLRRCRSLLKIAALRIIAAMNLLGVVLLAPLAWASEDGVACNDTLFPNATCSGNPTGSGNSAFPSVNRGFYGGFLVGGGVSTNDPIVQTGTAFPAPPPLPVWAIGEAQNRAGFMAGIHFGYEWSGRQIGCDPRWAILPALEFEGYYLGTQQVGFLNNLDSTNRLPEHLFDYRAPLNIGVLMPNFLVTLHTPFKIHPYAGFGVGTAIVSNSGATSLQLAPPEPGINHFNSNPNVTAWAPAATCRAGLRFDLGNSWYLFAEYKFLAIGATDYTFGPTVYSTHPPTTAWSVHYGTMFEHLGVLGLGCRF
jgi:opacity protein-like surface antigen